MLKTLLDPTNLYTALGLTVSLGIWLYTHFSKASSADQQTRLKEIEKYVAMASAAAAAVAADIPTSIDAAVAQVLAKVDSVLKAQGAPTMDAGETAKSALQAAASLVAPKVAAAVVASPK